MPAEHLWSTHLTQKLDSHIGSHVVQCGVNARAVADAPFNRRIISEPSSPGRRMSVHVYVSVPSDVPVAACTNGLYLSLPPNGVHRDDRYSDIPAVSVLSGSGGDRQCKGPA